MRVKLSNVLISLSNDPVTKSSQARDFPAAKTVSSTTAELTHIMASIDLSLTTSIAARKARWRMKLSGLLGGLDPVRRKP
uniref:Uncharacterized protein MANES_06G044400 n=1 Tax=Rhizophora mucronata TaxID=61149 RepID=A0A2P2L2A3_RHIMU